MFDPQKFDPLGPGTPAWNNFDKALHRRRLAVTTRPDDRDYKAYCNHRSAMKQQVLKHGGNAVAWSISLRQAIADPTHPDVFA